MDDFYISILESVSSVSVIISAEKRERDGEEKIVFRFSDLFFSSSRLPLVYGP